MKILSIASLLFLSAYAQAQTFTSYYAPDSTNANALVNNVALSVAVDSNDNAWFGTQEGISMFDGTTWTNYTDEDGLVYNTVKAIYVNTAGTMYAGTDFGISQLSDGNWSTLTTDDGLEDNKINCIFEDSSNQMWFGHADGASLWDGSEFTNYTMDDGLPFGGVASIAEDTQGRIWMGTGLGGCFILEDGTLTEITEDEGLLSNSVRDIETAGNMKWVATNIGISVFDGSDMHLADHDSIFTLPEPHEINPVEDIKIDSQGRVWAGVYVDYLVSVGGVSLYVGEEWHDYTEDDGLAGPVVGELALTSDNNVWVATSTGVTFIGDVPTGVETLSIKPNKLTLYPNPAKDWITIVSLVNDAEIFDLNGRKVMNVGVLGQPTLIWVGDLEAGVYLIRAGMSVEKIVVQ